MTKKEVLEKFDALPAEAQRQVADFITFLEAYYRAKTSRKPTRRLGEEAFAGIWRNRQDLEDSSAWVKSLREREWGSKA